MSAKIGFSLSPSITRKLTAETKGKIKKGWRHSLQEFLVAPSLSLKTITHPRPSQSDFGSGFPTMENKERRKKRKVMGSNTFPRPCCQLDGHHQNTGTRARPVLLLQGPSLFQTVLAQLPHLCQLVFQVHPKSHLRFGPCQGLFQFCSGGFHILELN